MNSTGPIENWNINPTEVGPIYPFVGWEFLMFAVGVVFCVAFIVWKFTTENSKYAEQARQLDTSGDLARAFGAEMEDHLD